MFVKEICFEIIDARARADGAKAGHPKCSNRIVLQKRI